MFMFWFCRRTTLTWQWHGTSRSRHWTACWSNGQVTCLTWSQTWIRTDSGSKTATGRVMEWSVCYSMCGSLIKDFDIVWSRSWCLPVIVSTAKRTLHKSTESKNMIALHPFVSTLVFCSVPVCQHYSWTLFWSTIPVYSPSSLFL